MKKGKTEKKNVHHGLSEGMKKNGKMKSDRLVGALTPVKAYKMAQASAKNLNKLSLAIAQGCLGTTKGVNKDVGTSFAKKKTKKNRSISQSHENVI